MTGYRPVTIQVTTTPGNTRRSATHPDTLNRPLRRGGRANVRYGYREMDHAVLHAETSAPYALRGEDRLA